MSETTKEKKNPAEKSSRIKALNYEHIKIPLIYLAMGVLWIYFSDRIANGTIADKEVLLWVNTYKGWLYVFVTSFVLYLLISRFRNKVDGVERQLRDSNAALMMHYNQLKYMAEHDQLTDLYNRRFFEDELIRLDTPESCPITVIIADINGLKLVNDSFGHEAGDGIIKEVAEIIRKAARKSDVACRLAGDEFIILCPNTDDEKANGILEKIKSSAEKTKYGQLDISISLGYKVKIGSEESITAAIKNAEDYMNRKKLYDSPSMRSKTIGTITATLHEKNKREEQHSQRVSYLCEQMGYALDLNEDLVKELKIVGLLHDIGKIGIDESILNKNGKLTSTEYEEIQKHPEIGYRILSTVNDLAEMAEYVLAHHERWDGKGYPKGIEGEAIPLQSRIIAIADAYDAMISERSYRNPLTKEEAIQELIANSGTQFNTVCVNAFVEKVLINEGVPCLK